MVTVCFLQYTSGNLKRTLMFSLKCNINLYNSKLCELDFSQPKSSLGTHANVYIFSSLTFK